MSSKAQKQAGYPLPDPIDGYDLVPFCGLIPDAPEYRSALWGTVMRLGKWWNWEKSYQPGDRSARDAAEYLREVLDSFQIGGDCGMFDCSQLDDCDNFKQVQLQTTLSVTFINQQTVIINQNNYDGTPTSVNPDAPDTTWDSDSERDIALCMAAQSWVASWCAYKAREIKVAMGATFALIALVAFLTGGVGLVAGLIVGGASLVAGVTYSIALAALENEDAIRAVACCMYNNLKGLAVSQANFQTSMGGCTTGEPLSHQSIIANLINDTLDEEANYLSFLDACGKAYVKAVFGVNDCECDLLGRVSFDSPDDLPYTVLYGQVAAVGKYGNGLEAAFWTSGGYSHGLQAQLHIELPQVSQVTQVRYDYHHYVPAFPGGGLAQAIFLEDETQSTIATWVKSPVTTKNTWITDSQSGDVSGVKYVRIYWKFVCDCPGANHLWLDNIRIT